MRSPQLKRSVPTCSNLASADGIPVSPISCCCHFRWTVWTVGASQPLMYTLQARHSSQVQPYPQLISAIQPTSTGFCWYLHPTTWLGPWPLVCRMCTCSTMQHQLIQMAPVGPVQKACQEMSYEPRLPSAWYQQSKGRESQLSPCPMSSPCLAVSTSSPLHKRTIVLDSEES
jgi:hypothetical protein